MIAVKTKGLKELDREIKSAPKKYRQAMVRAISTTRRDTKPEAVRIAQTVYTAGRNKISQAIKPGKVDAKTISFTMVASRRGISLVDFKHKSSARPRGKSKKERSSNAPRVNVSVQVLKIGGMVNLPNAFKARGKRSGKLRIIQRVGRGPYPAIALASSSVGDMINRPEVYNRLAEFGQKKMNSELLRQIQAVFRG